MKAQITTEVQNILFIEPLGTLGFKELTKEELFKVLEAAEINWFGVSNWSRLDLDKLQEKLEISIHFTMHQGLKKNAKGMVLPKELTKLENYTIRMHDMNYNFHHLYA